MAEDSFSSMGGDDDLPEISGVWGESDMSTNETLNDSTVSVASVAFRSTSTPKKKQQDSSFKRPVEVPKHFAQCTMTGCNKKYKTQNGFNNHLLDHRLKDIANKIGGTADVLNHLRANMNDTIASMITKTNCKNLREIIIKVQDAVTLDKWINFFEDVIKIVQCGLDGERGKPIMPLALRSNLQKSLNKSLCDKSLTQDLFEKFNLVTPCDITLFSLFLFDVLWELVDRSILFVCKSMMHQMPASSQSNVTVRGDAGHVLTHQVLHHVAGFSLYHHIRHANQYKNNAKLQRMKECILTQFVQSGCPPKVGSEDKEYWTHILNRKALLFVNDKAFPFFLQLGNLLLTCEDKDGSILLEKVLTSVMKTSSLLAVWDNIVNNTLDETESIDLLIKIVKVISRTYGRGNMLKKMNTLSNSTKANKGTLSISHRASLL